MDLRKMIWIDRWIGVPLCFALTRFKSLFARRGDQTDSIREVSRTRERYVDLARRLLKHFPEVYIAFTGAAEEGEKVRALVRQVGSERCFSLAGRTTLRQLLVLYGLAEVLVTNDSGPAHFAALTSIHTVTLFGPETPLLVAALNPRNTPLWAGIACSPCVSALNHRQSACRHNACMHQITVEQVFTAVCASYQERQATRFEHAHAPPVGATS